MPNVNFSVQFADQGGFPAGSAVDHLVLTVTGPESSTVNLAPNATSASVTISAAGGYTASVQAVDATGDHFGTAAIATFSIAAPATVTLSLPNALAATVS